MTPHSLSVSGVGAPSAGETSTNGHDATPRQNETLFDGGHGTTALPGDPELIESVQKLEEGTCDDLSVPLLDTNENRCERDQLRSGTMLTKSKTENASGEVWSVTLCGCHGFPIALLCC